MLALLSLVALADPPEPSFSAGSYGRVQVSTDLAGGGGDPIDVASHAPRLELDPYLELDLGWDVAIPDGPTFSAVLTPAISGDLFHYDGTWGGEIAVRNLYAQGDGLFGQPLTLWAGSRMYRGDDVFLLDFWPLDSLNTIGGGAVFAPGPLEFALHGGANRLQGDDWQFQEVLVATPGGVSGEPVVVLDRQRTVGSARVGVEVPVGDLTLRGRVYGELHALPAGRRLRDDTFAELLPQELPGDRGSVLGVQLSLWGWGRQSYVHLWARRSTGLAAYGELSIPRDGLATDLRVATARSHMLAVAGNTEHGPVGVMWGGYASRFTDADGQAGDWDDRAEWVGVVRPQVFVAEYAAFGVEASRQIVLPDGLEPRSGTLVRPAVTKLSVIPAVQVGPGGFSRPRLHAVYTVAFVNEDTRLGFDPLDARAQARVQHFVGIGAEWWVNSERVITPE